MLFKAKIKITLRPSILDVQGKTVMQALGNLGFEGVDAVRIGKYIEMELEESTEQKAFEKVEEACKKLLANTVMEDYSIELEDLKREQHAEG
jgi:phosphoribosylformylglycinamidine synthase